MSDFPAFAEGVDDNQREVLRLTQSDGDGPELPLAPVQAWPEDLQPFSELFPWQHILADSFFDALSDVEPWRMLAKRGFVRTDVVIATKRNFRYFLPDEPLPDSEGVHRTDHDVTVTDIVYLSKEDIGIMKRVRQSRRLAHVFWRFLTEWLVLHDSKGLDFREAPCECGETHRYYQSAWLEPLVSATDGFR